MTLPPRPILLRILLPAVALGLVYTLMVGLPGERELGTIQQSLHTLEARVPTPAQQQTAKTQFAQTRAHVADLTARDTLLTRELQEPAERIRHSRGIMPTQAAAPEVVRQLTRRMSGRHLVVVEEGPVESAASVPLPIYFSPPRFSEVPRGRNSAPPVRPTSTRAPRPDLVPKLWRIEFVGRYADTLGFLRILESDDLAATPAGLSMAPTVDDSPLRRWTLLIWI